MHLELTSSQRDLLLQLVDGALRDIGPEIRHTDDWACKEDLRETRRELQGLHTMLAATHSPATLESDSADLIGTP